MRVLVSPHLDLMRDRTAALVAEILAGPEGVVVPLAERGVRNLRRPLTQAEVNWMRQALWDPEESQGVVGYLCRGSGLGGLQGVDAVAVTDHANLTWHSPLAGPNDDRWGPRFPSMVGLYVPERVMSALGGMTGMIVASGVTAGVADDRKLTGFEAELTAAESYAAASSELVPVAIIAGHMGLKVAAVVLVDESKHTGEG